MRFTRAIGHGWLPNLICAKLCLHLQQRVRYHSRSERPNTYVSIRKASLDANTHEDAISHVVLPKCSRTRIHPVSVVHEKWHRCGRTTRRILARVGLQYCRPWKLGQRKHVTLEAISLPRFDVLIVHDPMLSLLPVVSITENQT